ncbi:MAG TPA: chromosome segregation protein SMC [Candidatus Limnocylindria bacterium]|nr:chromosome segregation protein SMC [Candidatus Limnocylindria bacterium]
MSRLRELRLHGFKTFADPTRFVFEPGVNAIIGPNGSGKSNMADAVRWVLGEQSNRSLRTRRADDVIFAGSQQRKPQGMAEAILTLDNADGWLPIDFNEVSVGRRAYRSGESEYLINGARARLRDVVELLGEGRLGANELVVVGQGTVDSALSLRPEERRQLFEEAAGVKNLQVRKNEALSRLGRARDNLTRVTDLIAELKPQVRRLGLQAQHAQEHDSLVTRARALVLEAHRRRETAERQALGHARRRAAAAEAALEEHRSAADANRRSIAEAEEAYWRADAAAREAAQRHGATREALVRAESALEGVTRRLDEAAAAIRAAEADLSGAIDGSSTEPLAGGDDPLTRAVTAAAAAEAGWEAASGALAELDLALLAAEERLAEARHRTGLRIADVARREARSARTLARREQLEQELEESQLEAATARESLPSLRTVASTTTQAADAARAAHETALAAIVEAQPTADAARRHASELAEKAGAMRGELDALQERAEGRGRLGSILTAAGWRVLLDGIDAPDDAWPAVEAIVGGELEQALLWQDDELAGRLVDARGSARLLAAGSPGAEGPSVAARAEALAAIGADRTLADWIGGDRVPVLFRWTALLPDVETLLGAWRRLPAGWLAVTPAGDVADSRGLLVLRGRAESNGSAAAQRHGRRRELAQALEAIDQEQAAAATEAARAMAAVAEAGRRLEDARRNRETCERDERAAAADLAGAELAAERAGAAESRLTDELAAIHAADPGADVDVESSPDVALTALEDEVAALRDRRGAATQDRDRAREAWSTAQAAAREIEDRQLGAERSRAVEAARQMQAEATATSQRVAQERLIAERADLDAALATAREADHAAAEARGAADAKRERMRATLVALEREVGEAGRLGELERAAQAAAIEASRHEESLGALARERELALDSLPQPGPVPGADGEEPAEAPAGEPVPPSEELVAELAALDDEPLDTELRRVRRTLSQIGSVNPFAVEEHRELSSRLEDLTTQDADLGSAIVGTEELIVQLDTDITSRFNAAFAAIGERFDDFCRLLFAGGSASLQLGDGEDGEAPGGIEIVVRPPGKRLQRLAMLSGGERALTGVALLFAMLSVNPVPFCILDEVDAALDEANIGRFADALRRLSEDIDFVVITHNRATIEVADTIYGVTMDNAAVSAVVSLRLADIPTEVAIG